MDLETLYQIGTTGALYIARSTLRFLVVGGGAFVLFWLVFADRFAHRRIQPELPERSVNWKELRNSLVGIVFFMTPVILMAPWILSGHTQLVMDPLATPWWVMILQFIVLVVAADTWFYWVHRLMHHPKLYAWTHELHHFADKPSPLSSYAFALVEGLLLGAFIPIMLWVMPLNFVVLAVFVEFFALSEAYVHLGYELMPRWLARNPVGRLLGTSVMHNMHHENGAYNFGVYFSWWDRLMGTLHPEYTERYEAVTAVPLFARPEAGDEVA